MNRGGDWLGQPRGLTVLVLTQMWEEFSYYGMRTLLVLYMVQGLRFAPAKASLIYGGYTAAAYLTPLLGGVIADRGLGRRRAVVLGGVLMAAGHFAMAMPGLFFPALALIAIGNGLFLPTLPAQVAGLYAPDDPRQATAMNVYYAGLNLGAVLAPLVCGALAEGFGWHWGFAAAGVGMLLGLLVYLWGAPALEPASETPLVAKTADAGAARRALLLLGVALAVVAFRGAYEQAGNTLALWIRAAVARRAFGLEAPVAWFQALNPLYVFLLTPLVVRWRGRPGATLRPLAAMRSGALIVASAFILLSLLAWTAVAGRVSGLWVLAFFGLYTLGELLILPTGLALFSSAFPGGLAATGIACWYLASFAGNLLSGVVGTLWGRLPPAAFFGLLAGLALLGAALLGRLERWRQDEP